jgi:hypothetical protein
MANRVVAVKLIATTADGRTSTASLDVRIAH